MLIDNIPERALFATCFRLAVFDFGRLMTDAIEQCEILHVTNIAGLRTDVN